MSAVAELPLLDDIDRRIIRSTQAGLPLVPQPYHAVAAELGLEPGVVIERMARMQGAGLIRRIGIVPNHYAIGYRANGMTVWDVDDDRIVELGERVGALDFVTHCYQRPRILPDWPYNLFAMIHGADRTETGRYLSCIAAVLGDACRAQDVLYSTRILKKTGLRLGQT